MQRRSPQQYLTDVRDAALVIERLIRGQGLQGYVEGEAIHLAVEREFIVIGEALTQLQERNPAMAARIPRLRAIIGFRNLLVHGYDAIQHERVWATATQQLPELRATVEQLLAE